MKITEKMHISVLILLCIITAIISIMPCMNVQAEEVVLFPEVNAPSEGNVFVGVRGSYLEAVHVLDEMNRVRREACEQGVPNPANPSEKLTMDDYVPLKWSSDIESVCRIRAVEGLIGNNRNGNHNRLTDKSIYIATKSGISCGSEILAGTGGWPFNEEDEEANADADCIWLWESEKQDWVNRTKGAVTGHYTSMINPRNQYVGVGVFLSKENGMYYYAGQFAKKAPVDAAGNEMAVDGTRLGAIENCIQLIEMKKTYLSEPEISLPQLLPYWVMEDHKEDWEGWCEHDPTVEKPKVVGDSDVYECIYRITDAGVLERGGYIDRVLVAGNITWTSANSKIATVNQNGKITYKKKGTTTITATTDAGTVITKELKVGYNKIPKPSIKSLKGGKKSFTIKAKSKKGITGYEVQYSKDRKFKKGVYDDGWSKSITGNKVYFRVKKKGKYYVRIRSYRIIKSYEFTSSWTKAKKVKVK